MLENHPAIKWGGVVLGFAGPIIAAILWASSVSVRLDEQQQLIQDGQRHGETMFLQIERGFEELEEGQHGLHDSIATTNDDLNFRIGALHGRLLERGE